MRGGAFKPRTSPFSFQGLKKAGLEMLGSAGERYGLPVVTDLDLPVLFRSTGKASGRAQTSYTRLIAADLALMIISAMLGALSVGSGPAKSTLAVASGAMMAVSLILTGVLGTRRPEKKWYGGRAIAESVKTLAWRYMVGAEPYGVSVPEATVDKKFLATLEDILKERKEFQWEIDDVVSKQPEITERMQEIRKLSLEERKAVYSKYRVNNQLEWYSRKAAKSRAREVVWFWSIIAAQALAFIAAMVRIGFPSSPLNLTGVFSALAAAFLSWLQTKRYQELAQSYAVAAYELGLIAEQARHVQTDEAFSAFVVGAENAMSREHTLWSAKRERT